MREDQFMGLNEWAQKFLEDNLAVVGERVIVERYNDGTVTETVEPIRDKGEIYDEARGFTCWPLRRYTLKDGTQVEEFLQDMPWSGGPVIFYALRRVDGDPIPKSLWSREEIIMMTVGCIEWSAEEEVEEEAEEKAKGKTEEE